MKKRYSMLGAATLLGAVALFWMFAMPRVPMGLSIPQTTEAVARGEYLVIAGGCRSCHENTIDGDTLAGGRGIESPFGTFYASNITPDFETGIGGWSAADFIYAIKHGRSHDKSFYYPAFPYRSYSALADADVLDIAAYLMALPPQQNAIPQPTDTPFWLNRWLLAAWNVLADLRQPEWQVIDDPQLARGAYLARNLGHCGECHTPRDMLGIPDLSREFAGSEFDNEHVDAIDAEALADWTAGDFELFLRIGLEPDGDFAGGAMSEVIEHNTSLLTDDDRAAMAAFFTRHNR